MTTEWGLNDYEMTTEWRLTANTLTQTEWLAGRLYISPIQAAWLLSVCLVVTVTHGRASLSEDEQQIQLLCKLLATLKVEGVSLIADAGDELNCNYSVNRAYHYTRTTHGNKNINHHHALLYKHHIFQRLLLTIRHQAKQSASSNMNACSMVYPIMHDEVVVVLVLVLVLVLCSVIDVRQQANILCLLSSSYWSAVCHNSYSVHMGHTT